MKKLLIFFLSLFIPSVCNADGWKRKADFPNGSRCGAFGFSIGNKGYVGGGWDGSYLKNFWEFDPLTNSWTQKANFPGIGSAYTVSFNLGNKGYVCTGAYELIGSPTYSCSSELWEYDPGTDSWTQKTSYPSYGRMLATVFVIDGLAYVGTGYGPVAGTFKWFSDFYCYNASNNTWKEVASLPQAGADGSGFSIFKKGYVMGLADSNEHFLNGLWQYDPSSDSWFPKTSFPDTARCDAVSFSINNIGYFGTGDDGNFFNDFWEYCERTDSWTQKTSLPSVRRDETAYFTIGNKGYICLGCGRGLGTSEVWEYTPDSVLACQESTDCGVISLPDTLITCDSPSIIIPTVNTTSCPILNMLWTPSTGLNDPTILKPTLTVSATSAWYYLTTTTLLPFNLVQNENFGAGYFAFISDYSFSGPGVPLSIGEYRITTNPATDDSVAVSFGDHTTGTGNMLAIKAGPTPTKVWYENIAVKSNTSYAFSAWFANWSKDTSISEPLIQFMVNDTLIGVPYNLTRSGGEWEQFYLTWKSYFSGNIVICIKDMQTASSGNYLAIDDIAFQEISSRIDSIYIYNKDCPAPVSPVVVHNVITPNGDGVNDVWVIDGIKSYPQNTVQLYNKWGNMVYEKVNYNNDWGGSGLPDGTYYYLVKLNAANLLGSKNVWTGYLMIKR